MQNKIEATAGAAKKNIEVKCAGKTLYSSDLQLFKAFKSVLHFFPNIIALKIFMYVAASKRIRPRWGEKQFIR